MNITKTKAGASLLLFAMTGGMIPGVHAAFVHPGVLQTQADIDRMRTKVLANAEPWKGSYDRLTSSSFSSASYTPNPQARPCAGGGGCPDGESFLPMARDAAAAYQNALRYRISGDTAHANKAVQIMMAWANTMTGWAGDSNQSLRAGLYGYQWAAAAELMRGYSGWSSADFTKFKDFLFNMMYQKNRAFLDTHNGTCFDHYWTNWDMSNLASALAISIVRDDQARFDHAINYFKTGVGTAQIDNMVVYLYAGNPELGQGQESGRDQGHATLCIPLAACFAQIAYNQGQDMYAYKNNKLKAFFEYTAKYNLNLSVPYTAYQNCDGWNMTAIASGARGTARPGWDMIYNHYVKVKGLTGSVPFSEQFAENMRPEGGAGHYGTTSGGFDQLGFTTLTHYRDPVSLPSYYKLSNVGTGLYIDGMFRSANGSACGQWAESTSYNQQWAIESVGTYRKLRNRSTGLYVDGMGRTTNGSDCGQWAGGSSNNQQWTEELVDGLYKYRNRATGLYMDGLGRTTNGSALAQWSGGNSSNQRFRRTPL